MYTRRVKLETPLSAVLRTTREFLEALEDMDLRTVQDLLLYLPRAHEDLSQMHTIASARIGEKVTLRGTVSQIKLVRLRGRKMLVSAVFTDTDGATVEVIWFNQPHVKRMLNDGDDVVFTGKLSEKGFKLQMQSPQFETGGSGPLVHAGRLVPVYPQHDIIHTKWLREKMVLVKDAIDLLPETLPEDIVQEEKLMSRREMIRSLHFPDTPEDVQRANERLAFEEMFGVQREALQQKKEWQGEGRDELVVPMDAALIRALFKCLKFTPTDDQRRAIFEILQDMEKPQAMSRLLEGDVGSGKTLVATAVMANVLQHGGQCALMVPTEVLARQHADSIGRMLLQMHAFIHGGGSDEVTDMRLPTIAVLTGSVPTADANDIRRRLASGTLDLVIGTHALIEDSVQFRSLRLVIVDEQHRFGVNQRQRLKEKGSPHFLAMTATPIPRTLALTAYGHHDLSVLLSKPNNRKPIATKAVSPKDRKTVELFIDQQIDQGRQVFVICPLISESASDEMMEVRNVEQEAARLREEFPRRRIAILHGKMLPREKEDVMRAFKEKQYDLLVSTSVIEVGIDVPNATIIIIEGAERFGLSQLHQFRGRVGRGEHQSYCFLFTTQPQQASSPRLKAMEKYDSGFQLAEIDLTLRGPGELFGLRQSGMPDLRVSSLMQPELVVRARRAAERFLGMAPARSGV